MTEKTLGEYRDCWAVMRFDPGAVDGLSSKDGAEARTRRTARSAALSVVKQVARSLAPPA